MNNVSNPKPQNNLISNPIPSNNILRDTNFAYLETRTINKGQPLPWGLNWALTYPTTFSFVAQRL